MCLNAPCRMSFCVPALVCWLSVLVWSVPATADTPDATAAAFGTWASPITADRAAASAARLSDVRTSAGNVYWTESKPADGGRNAVMVLNGQGEVRDVTPRASNVRTRVHEYGGAPFAVSHGRVYFSEASNQRIYVQSADGEPVALTPDGYRYADCVPSPSDINLICVREDHLGKQVVNSLVSLSTQTPGAGEVLYAGSDFVAYPRVSPDGRSLAWVGWDHPNMPWDTTSLYLADLTSDGLANVRVVAGGSDESVLEPNWDADGSLYFVSDRSDWWNLYRLRGGRVETVTSLQADIASPLWQLGQANFALTGDGRAVLKYARRAVDTLAVVDLVSGVVRPLSLPFVGFQSVQLLSANVAVTVAASRDADPALICVHLDTGSYEVKRAAAAVQIERSLLALAEPIEFPAGRDGTAHAFFYAPTNPRFTGNKGARPPLLVKVHGGPTSSARPAFDRTTQFWTSRGFALVDVNYRGSSGYGRRFRESLNGNWGLTDVEDVVAAVKYLAGTARIDAGRVAIRGSSAGGFTTLAALAANDVFKVGAAYYGISDLEAMARDTHKFESHYLDRLVAPLPAGRQIYIARSPIHNLRGFNEPLVAFQGQDDKIVTPIQSRMIIEALKIKGVPSAYIEIAGERHGFQKPESIARTLNAELYFYGRIFKFTPAGDLAELHIDNLP